MLIKVLGRVTDENIRLKDGSTMRLRGQFAELYTLDHAEAGVVSFKVSLDESDPPYAPGWYSVGRESYETDRNRLGFAYRVRLTPAPAAVVQALGFHQVKGPS